MQPPGCRCSPDMKRLGEDVNAYRLRKVVIFAVLLVTTLLTFLVSSGSGPQASLLGLEWRTPELMEKDRAQFLEIVRDELTHLAPDVLSSMDFSIDPCTNFFEFSCGKWIQDTEIPSDKARVEKSWDEEDSQALHDLRTLFEDSEPSTPGLRRLHTYYAACMDEDQIEKRGADPLIPLLSKIDAVSTPVELSDMLVELCLAAIPNLAVVTASVDLHNRSQYALFIRSNAMTMPDFSYYFDQPGANASSPDVHWKKQNRAALREEFTALSRLAGYNQEETDSAVFRTLEIEALVASFQSQEPFQHYLDAYPGGLPNMNLSALEDLAPNLPWRLLVRRLDEACVEAAGVRCMEHVEEDAAIINVDQPGVFQRLSRTIAEKSPTYWVPFLRLHTIRHLATLLSAPFLNATLSSQSATMGVRALLPRWQKCVKATRHALPEDSDLAFQRRYFPPLARAKGWELLRGIHAAFLAQLRRTSWFDPATRARALSKAERMILNLGGADPAEHVEWEVGNASYFDNAVRASFVGVTRVMLLLGAAPDREHPRWKMYASAVNAYYDNAANAIFIPAAVMQRPMFRDDYHPARNFGGIGVVVGHEMTHGFDNRGSHYNERAEREAWWSADARESYRRRLACIQRLFDGFSIAGFPVDGRRTLGEAVADFGGVQTARRALTAHLGEGIPPDASRLFFLAFGQMWCSKGHPGAEMEFAAEDPHPPGAFRTNGVVSQLRDFAAAFRCPSGTPMNPLHKCSLWPEGDS